MADFKQLFYSQLQNHFVGHEIHGQSGYVNLLSLKSKYFAEIIPFLKKEIRDITGTDTELEKDLYDRLNTFFECYLNDTGTPFFSKTPPQKNLYERVYNDKDDVALFWKTQRLYYVKSEEDYKDLEVKPEGCPISFKFKTDFLIRKQNNEKKNLKFVLTHHSATELTIQAMYEDNSKDNKYNLLREYLNLQELVDIRNKLIEGYGTQLHASIIFVENGIDQSVITKPKDKFKWLNIIANNDTIKSVSVLLAPTGTDGILSYLESKHIPVTEAQLEEAFKTFRRQTVIDYFIHKDAEGFLKEQFDLYVYNWLCNDLKTEFDLATVTRMQKVKKAAYTTIEYIAKFEDELKAIWEKPKFVFNSNYVITLDRIAEKKIDLITKLINHSGMAEQIKEWQELGIVDESFDKKTIMKSKTELAEKFCKLPIDTKYFKDIELEILKEFDNLDDTLDGWLIKSENWQALNTIIPKYKDRAQTIYIDPPFNTGEDFSFLDKYQDSTWLSIMQDRLELADEFINRDGHLFLHLDENANYLGRLLLKQNCKDEIKEIVFNTNGTTDEEADLFGYKSFGDLFVLSHQTIFHVKHGKMFNKLWKPNRNTTNLNIGWLDLISKQKTDRETHDKIQDYNFFIEYYNDGKNLNYKKIDNINESIYAISDIWNDLYSFTQSEMRVSENVSFFTQKPENVMRRIIQSSSNKNDFVIDFFSGSGTTLIVAHKLKRKWIGVEMGDHFGHLYYDKKGKLQLGLLGRLKHVLNGDKQFSYLGKKRRSHLSKDINYCGGGFFKYYELEQYEDVLRKAIYKPLAGSVELDKTSFRDEQKLLYAVDIDYENKITKIDFSKIYPEKQIDLAETLSNLSGNKIKRLTDKGCILCDRSSGHELPEIDFSNLTLEAYPWLKPLIWWYSR